MILTLHAINYSVMIPNVLGSNIGDKASLNLTVCSIVALYILEIIIASLTVFILTIYSVTAPNVLRSVIIERAAAGYKAERVGIHFLSLG